MTDKNPIFAWAQKQSLLLSKELDTLPLFVGYILIMYSLNVQAVLHKVMVIVM